MGNNNSKKDPYWILTDENGIIIDISNCFLEKFLFEKVNIVGSFIGTIMSPFISYLHEHIFIPKYKSLSNLEKNIVNVLLSGKTKQRPLLIYDILRNPHYVFLSVNYNFKKSNFKAVFTFQNDIWNHNLSPVVKSNFTNEITVSKNRVIVLTAKITYSNFLYNNDEDILNVQQLRKSIKNTIISIIKKYYYPYIYFYESYDNFFVFLLNCEWGHTIESYIASLSLSFVYKILKERNDNISIQFGVVFNRIYFNFEEKFRIYGLTKYLSKKLSIITSKNVLYADSKYVEKLLSENIFDISNYYTIRNNNIHSNSNYYEIYINEIRQDNNPFIF